MKLVFLLGVFSLLALSSIADTETSLTALHREVRQASKGVQGRLKRASKKGRARRGKKGKKASQMKGLRGNERKGGDGKKSRKGKRRIKGRGKKRRGSKGKGGKGKRNRSNKTQKFKTRKTKKNERTESSEPTLNCTYFYGNLTKFRYDQNMLRKAIRIGRIITKLDNKVNKSSTAFMDGAEFFKDCPLPEGQEIYNVLSECNVTVPDFCSPKIFFEENSELVPLYEALDNCTRNLTKSTEEGNNCTTFCPHESYGECSYTPVRPDCNYKEFEEKLKDFSNVCFKATVQGSFSNCTSFLRDSYDTAIECCNTTSTSTMTTRSPAAALLKLRKFNDFKSWKMNL